MVVPDLSISTSRYFRTTIFFLYNYFNPTFKKTKNH